MVLFHTHTSCYNSDLFCVASFTGAKTVHIVCSSNSSDTWGKKHIICTGYISLLKLYWDSAGFYGFLSRTLGFSFPLKSATHWLISQWKVVFFLNFFPGCGPPSPWQQREGPHCSPDRRMSGDRKRTDSRRYARTRVDQRKWAPADREPVRQLVSTHQDEAWKIMQPFQNEVFDIFWRLDATVSLILGTSSLCGFECELVVTHWNLRSFS